MKFFLVQNHQIVSFNTIKNSWRNILINVFFLNFKLELYHERGNISKCRTPIRLIFCLHVELNETSKSTKGYGLTTYSCGLIVPTKVVDVLYTTPLISILIRRDLVSPYLLFPFSFSVPFGIFSLYTFFSIFLFLRLLSCPLFEGLSDILQKKLVVYVRS